MFGIGKRRAQLAAESARMAGLATQLHHIKKAAHDAADRLLVNYVAAGMLALLGLVVLGSAIATAHLAGWDMHARVPSGRVGTGALWAVFAWRAALGLLAWAGAVALLIGGHRVIRKENQRLTQFLVDHTSDLPTIEPLEIDLTAADLAMDARVKQERARPSLPPVADVLATASSDLRTQRRAAISRVAGAKVRRTSTLVLGPLLMAIGIFFISLGITPAHNAGWDLTSFTPAGRIDGVLPLWFVVALAFVLGFVIFAGGVASLVGGFLAVRTAQDWLVRFRFSHENELPTAEHLVDPHHVP
jgi:hypothetical protein